MQTQFLEVAVFLALVMASNGRSLKRGASEISDGWGDAWPADCFKKEADCFKKEPDAEYSDAQPWHWHNWQGSEASTIGSDSAPSSDGGTGGSSDWSGWYSDGGKWGTDHWPSNTGSSSTDELWNPAEVEAAERELEEEAHSGKYGTVADDEQHTIETTKKHMTQKDLKKTESLQDAYDLWKKNKLPASHKILVDMRRKHANDEEYQNAKTIPEKKAFQEKFMKTELSGMVEKYEYNEELIEEQKEEGELYSFDRIVTFEGGAQNPANIIAAKEICRECLRRGPPYAKRSGWSKRVKYMYVVEGFSNRKKASWKITKTGEAEKQRSPTPKRDDGKKPGVPKEKKQQRRNLLSRKL